MEPRACKDGKSEVLRHENKKGRSVENRCNQKNWFSGRGWGQQRFSFQSPAVHWVARTSSLNFLSCWNPYQTPHSLNASPLFTEKPFFFFAEKCFVASPSQKNRLLKNSAEEWLSPICGGRHWATSLEPLCAPGKGLLARTFFFSAVLGWHWNFRWSAWQILTASYRILTNRSHVVCSSCTLGPLAYGMRHHVHEWRFSTSQTFI